MDLSARLSGTKYRSLAERWRRLAEAATTPQTKNHLRMLARRCEFLAGDGIELAPEKPEELGLLVETSQ